jgi:hypothetical protein
MYAQFIFANISMGSRDSPVNMILKGESNEIKTSKRKSVADAGQTSENKRKEAQ